MSFIGWQMLYEQMQEDLVAYLATGEWQTKRYRIGEQEHELNDADTFMKLFEFVEKRAIYSGPKRMLLKNVRREWQENANTRALVCATNGMQRPSWIG